MPSARRGDGVESGASGKRQGEFKTRGVHANQVFASINAAVRMLNLVVHWSLSEVDGPAAESGREAAGTAQHVA